MKAIIRREVINYLKRPLFWIAIVIVTFGIFQQLSPYLSIHYITSEEVVKSDDPETVVEGEVFEGYIPSSEEKHRELWDKSIQESLVTEFGMEKNEATEVIKEIR